VSHAGAEPSQAELNLTPERRTPNAERRTWNAERGTPNAERDQPRHASLIQCSIVSTLPTAAINAAVDNGGKALITGANATVENLTIGATTTGSTVEVTTGTSLTINALTIGPGGTLYSDVGSLFTQSGGFVNNGNLVVTAGTFNSAPITGNGTVTKNDFGETVFWQAPLQAGSTIVVNAGTFVDESTAVGAVSVTGTGTFQVNAGFSLTQGATLNNGGALDNFGNVTGPVGMGMMPCSLPVVTGH
jgi:hypothetical protein